MLKKEATQITGGLSKPNKMPGPSINLPASHVLQAPSWWMSWAQPAAGAMHSRAGIDFKM